MCRSFKPGQGERECVWLAFTGRGGHAGSGKALHTYLHTPQINKQIHIKPLLIDCCLILKYLTIFHSQYARNLPLNIKHTFEHLKTQKSDHIHYRCCLHIVCIEGVGHRTGQASEGTQPAESTEAPRVITDMQPCIVVTKCRISSRNSSRSSLFGRPDGREQHILTAIKSGLYICFMKTTKFCIIFNKKGLFL